MLFFLRCCVLISAQLSVRVAVNQNCLWETVVYAALIKENNSEETKYTGSTEGPFKQRFYGHKSDQKLKKYKNRTKLSQHIWYRKEKGEPINIQWKIIKKRKKI